MPIILAAPVSSGHQDPIWPRRKQTWTGVDGSVWPLVDDDAVPRLRPGVVGLHMPRFDTFDSEVPLEHGSDLRGYRVPARKVYWPLLFFAASVDEWANAYAGFFDSFNPIQPGTWTVGEGLEERTLGVTYVDDGAYAFDHDPFETGIALIGMELRAPRPMWRGKPISKSFRAEGGVDFIGGDDGPPFHISPSGTLATAAIRNPGNEPAYPQWIVEGPLDNVRLGVGDVLIHVPMAVGSGSRLVIDTDPAAQFATLDGSDVTRELGFQVFAPIPAGGSTPLTILAAGAGTVTAKLTPLYWRAF